MIKAKQLTVGLDCDDVVFECNSEALKRLNAETGSSSSIEQIDNWKGGASGINNRIKYFSSADFVATQPLAPGAKDFVRKLLHRGCDVVFITAVPPDIASIRANRILACFPEVNPQNIILTSRKDLCNVDILIDDAPHNILASPAKYPILFRQPWNRDITGCLAVNDFEEDLHLVDTIILQGGYQASENSADILCLVGPSGSGKTEIVEALCATGQYAVPKIYTTSDRSQAYYHHISRDQFVDMRSRHCFAEITSYAGEYFGVVREDLTKGIGKAKLVIPIDICGANALKRLYGRMVKTVYIDRSREAQITGILAKDIPEKSKVIRIMALDGEKKNAALCDEIINNRNLESTIAQLIKM